MVPPINLTISGNLRGASRRSGLVFGFQGASSPRQLALGTVPALMSWRNLLAGCVRASVGAMGRAVTWSRGKGGPARPTARRSALPTTRRAVRMQASCHGRQRPVPRHFFRQYGQTRASFLVVASLVVHVSRPPRRPRSDLCGGLSGIKSGALSVGCSAPRNHPLATVSACRTFCCLTSAPRREVYKTA